MRQVTFVEGQDDELRWPTPPSSPCASTRASTSKDFRTPLRHNAGRGRLRPALAEMTDAGLLERDNGTTRLTRRGRLLANEVFVRLLPDTV